MTPNERIEVVARRIREQRDAEPYLYYFTELGSEAQKVILSKIVAATLQSLLDPSEGMVAALSQSIDDAFAADRNGENYDETALWRAMMQQAIKEMA